MAGIFINYRRDDARAYAGRLADDLIKEFGEGQIFQDIDRIDPGSDFLEAIQEALNKCEIVLALIGPNWADAKDRKGRRRLDNPQDFVVLELAAALERKIAIIPVLVGGAEMPDADQLPSQLALFARRQAHEISDNRWRYDVQELVGKIKRALAVRQSRTIPAAPPKAPAPEKRPFPAVLVDQPAGPQAQSHAAATSKHLAGTPWPPTVKWAAAALLVIVATSAIYIGARSKGGTQDDTSSRTQSAGATTTMVRIGHVGPLTGGIAHLGKDNENGAQLAIDEANAAKIRIDGKEVKFTLLVEDDQADPRVGTTVAQKLVDAKVAGVVGHLNSGTSIPASPIYSQAGIPVISGSATNPKLTEQGFKTQFRVVGRDDEQGPAVASFLVSNNKPMTVAVIDDATAYGEGIANEVEKTLKAAKITVLPREKGTDRTTDWKAILTKLRGRNPDAVFYGGMDATGGPLLKQGRELGIKAVFAFGDGACTDKMKELAGDAAEGLLCSQAGLPVEAADKKFLDAYKKRFNAAPILYAPFTYDATNALIAAMKAADSTDPERYLPALAALSYRGVTGRIEFDRKGDRRRAEITIFTMKGGRIEPIAVVRDHKSIPFAAFLSDASR